MAAMYGHRWMLGERRSGSIIMPITYIIHQDLCKILCKERVGCEITLAAVGKRQYIYQYIICLQIHLAYCYSLLPVNVRSCQIQQILYVPTCYYRTSYFTNRFELLFSTPTLKASAD